MTGWVTFEELREVSGLTQPAAVRRWLEERGIPYLTRADGRPVTRASAMTREQQLERALRDCASSRRKNDG